MMIAELLVAGCLACASDKPLIVPVPYEPESISMGDCSRKRVCERCPYCGEDVCEERLAHPDNCRLMQWHNGQGPQHQRIKFLFPDGTTYIVCIQQPKPVIERLVPGGKWGERMSVSRYTSLALSRALRDAGAPQDEGEAWHCATCGLFTIPFLCAGPTVARAFRLDELIELLEAEGVIWWQVEDRREDCTRQGREYAARASASAAFAIGVNYGTSPVEAAGNLLLAVLRAKEQK